MQGAGQAGENGATPRPAGIHPGLANLIGRLEQANAGVRRSLERVRYPGAPQEIGKIEDRGLIDANKREPSIEELINGAHNQMNRMLAQIDELETTLA